MPLSDKLLEKLVCPGCKNKLTYDKNTDKLTCETCQLVYKVNNEIPVLLADEAEKI